MESLSTEYMGLRLRNPIILGNCPYTNDLDGLKKAEDSGIGAIVLNSLFEEQIDSSAQSDMSGAEGFLTHADAFAFLSQASTEHYVDKYMDLVEKAKASLDIPVIASINCTSDSMWLDIARRFASCGADAVEINHFIIPSDCKETGSSIESKYLKFAKKARSVIKMPLSMKIGWHFSSIPNMVKNLSDTGVDGIVMFNHFFRPDIDIEKVCVDSENTLQPKGDYGDTLRWTAMMSSEIDADICASTGIRNASTVVKMLLAGAKATQISSVVSMNGFSTVKEILDGLGAWMDRHGYDRIEDFRGLLSQEKVGDPQSWERSVCLKLYSGFRAI